MNPILGASIFVCGIFWIIVFVYYFTYYSVKKKCTTIIKAKIIGTYVDSDNIEIGYGDSIRYISNSAKYPIYMYEYNGHEYKTQASYPVWKSKIIGIGDTVDIHINPKDPKILVTKDMEKLVVFKLLAGLLIPSIIVVLLLILS